jgi:hypothetical protein
MSDIPAPNISSSARDATCVPFGDGLFGLTLSHENKAELFKEAISKLSQSSDEASSILNNLNEWNPTDASRFALRSSSMILDTPFQLIFPTSARPSFDETGLYVRQYLAISYCWNSSDVSHDSWPISKPFVEAVLGEKDHPREGIWMDQLCIDQSSSIHKAESIAAMDIIYRSCIRLVVLLEDVFLDERESQLPGNYNPNRVPEGVESELYASFFHKVNGARWWQRAWCLHEFSVNDPWTDKRRCNYVHNATFIVNGPNGTTIKIKWFDLHMIMSSTLLAFATPGNNVLSTFNGQYIFSGVERGNDVQNGMSSSLMARHNGVIQKGSRFLADRLSILINMCGLGLAYVGGEMETEDEFLYFSTLLALALGERYSLSMFSQRSILFGNVPTWLAPSTAPKDTSIPRFALGGIQCVHRISMQNIELDMIFFKPHLEKIADEDLERTYAIFPEKLPPEQSAGHVSSESEEVRVSTHVGNNLVEFRRRFLAGCIMNGYSFIARLWEQLNREIVGRDYRNGITPDPTLQLAAQELVAQLTDSGLENDLSSQPFTIEDAHLFLTWLTDPRSAYYTGFLHPYSLSCTSDGQKALVTALHANEEKLNDGPDEELQVAIPVDLLAETCSLLRAWVLRPVNNTKGTSRWKLVGKALLLGEPDLMRDVEISSEREGVRTVSSVRTIVGG